MSLHRLAMPWVWRALLGGLLVVVWRIALAPVTSHEPDWFENADKVRHMAAFFTFWCVGHPGFARRYWLGLALGLLSYGAAIEIAQSLTPDRDASLADWIADALGLTLGHQVSRWWPQRLRLVKSPTT